MPLPPLIRLDGIAPAAEACLEALWRTAAKRRRGGEPFDLAGEVARVLSGAPFPRWPAYGDWMRRFQELAYTPATWRECLGDPPPAALPVSDAGVARLYAHTLGEESAKLLDLEARRAGLAAAGKSFIIGGDFDDLCPTCSPWRGRKFDPANTPGDCFPPFHPGCRCRTGVWTPRLW
ncbi:MAG: hypothetical protein HY719_17795 [Planctomycetes bacterium]|nr:hypothetical protein [Planctomycetota bacterium]